jgi:hypothetical protein
MCSKLKYQCKTCSLQKIPQDSLWALAGVFYRDSPNLALVLVTARDELKLWVLAGA